MGELQQGAWGKSSKATVGNTEGGTRNDEVTEIDSLIHRFIDSMKKIEY
jgi:hypothetical protein